MTRAWHAYRPGCCPLPDEQHVRRKTPRASRKGKPRKKQSYQARYYVGVDGEGYDTPDGRHIYVYLCAADESGRIVSEAYNPAGLSTEECKVMLLAIPARAVCFGFMFQYDITKIIEGLDKLERYRLMRPELRARRRGKFTWRKRVADLDFFAGSFSLKSEKKIVHVWDCFKFFQQSFVKALEAWDIGTPEERARIADMKAQRGSFETTDINQVKTYCADECRLLACMMRKVVEAHRQAGIELTRYEGAGSSASALLKKNKIVTYLPKKPFRREIMQRALQAFTGGRFEHSFIGLAKGNVYGRDIRSAYPAMMRGLPCLKHGKWRHTTSWYDVAESDLALCRMSVQARSTAERNRIAWQPLPCRCQDGSIVFGSGFSGWYHKEESEQALRWPGTNFHEAWVYESTCDHDPFEWVDAVFRERVRWGSDGPGLSLKLALNACNGKFAQSIGSAPFQSLIWSGAIMARTRAALLSTTAIDAWHVLSMATDGVHSRREVVPATEAKILGSWEGKTARDVLFVKPGMYWAIDDTEYRVRARGIGRKEAFEHRSEIARALEVWDRKDFGFGVTVKARRFYGAKASLYAYSHCRDCDKGYAGAGKCAAGHVPDRTDVTDLVAPDGMAAYGRWVVRDIRIEFNPLPKREAVMRGGRLRTRDLGGIESAAYEGKTTPEGLALSELKESDLEQPDAEDW